MSKTEQTSRRLVWTIIGVAIVVFVMISVILFILFGANTPENKATDSKSTTSSEKIATEQEVRDNIEDLNATLRQASKDQKAAKSAINDSKNQVKIGG